jgi:hypothetical protein
MPPPPGCRAISAPLSSPDHLNCYALGADNGSGGDRRRVQLHRSAIVRIVRQVQTNALGRRQTQTEGELVCVLTSQASAGAVHRDPTGGRQGTPSRCRRWYDNCRFRDSDARAADENPAGLARGDIQNRLWATRPGRGLRHCGGGSHETKHKKQTRHRLDLSFGCRAGRDVIGRWVLSENLRTLPLRTAQDGKKRGHCGVLEGGGPDSAHNPGPALFTKGLFSEGCALKVQW